MDRTFGPPWHCVVGKGFGSAVGYLNRHYIFLYIANKAILIFKYWQTQNLNIVFTFYLVWMISGVVTKYMVRNSFSVIINEDDSVKLIYLLISWNHVLPKHHQLRRVTVKSFRSININVIPSFGHIVNIGENDKQRQVRFLALRFKKFRHGEPEKELCTTLPEILTHPATPPSVLERLSNSLCPHNIFMNMSKGQDSAEDSDFDSRTIYT